MDLNASAAWQITRGAGKRPVRVAVIDNGMQISHKDLNGAIVSGGFFNPEGVGLANFVRLTPGMADFPPDPHGTFCLGLVGARINNDDGCGIAPEANLIAIACANDQTGTQTTLARAIHYAADPHSWDSLAKSSEGADVISCSLNTQNLLHTALKDAIHFAYEKGRSGLGVPVFWAASNEHTEISKDMLCSHHEIIPVASYDRTGAKFVSAFGPQLEYLAPGRDVFSTNSDNGFSRDSGTSFATPLAAGVAALVLALQPGWNKEQIRNLLRKSCDQIGPLAGHNDETGYGRLNAAIAAARAKAGIV
jgi:thermitase